MNKGYLLECLRYNHKTGELIWRKRPRHHFKNNQAFGAWNTKFSGMVAGNEQHGYIKIKLDGKTYSAHRLAWLYTKGCWPRVIDHIDGDKSNNRIENLRDVSFQENMLNKRRSTRNKTGLSGVHWATNEGRWKAQIARGKDRRFLGTFDCFLSACCARKRAEKLLGFHENHGNYRAMEAE